MKTRNVCRKISLLVNCAALVFAASSSLAVESRIITFQGGDDAASENTKRLIGHWRKTTIVFESPKDEHLFFMPMVPPRTGSSRQTAAANPLQATGVLKARS